LSAADRELREMRDAIIHCDGSPEMTTNLAGLLANDLPALNEPATRFLLECVEELPVKTPVYAALLGLLNKTSPEFAEEAVGAVVTRLEERLGSTSRDDQSRAKLLTRFLTMLPQVGVVKHTDAIDVLDALVCAAGDAADVAIAKSRQGDSDKRAGHLWQPRSDFLVGCALAATPWCGASFASATEPGAADAFDRLLTSVEEYLAKRNRRGPDPSAMTFGAGGASEDAGASLADDWLEETFGRVNETRRAGRANPEAWTTASVPALLSAFPEFSTEALSTRDETRVPPPTKVPFLSFASVSEALAAYPVRPRLRCVAFPFFFFRHSCFVVFRRTKAKRRRGDDTYTFITSR
jgi:nuclear cap-binding protein subunit 1